MKVRTLSATALLLTTTLCGCASHPASGKPTEPIARNVRAETDSAPSVSLEALEAESRLQTGISSEARNLRLAQLWYQRGDKLSGVAGPSSTTSYLRSAHFAIESLLSEPCANPFNETCRDLHKLYLLSTEKIVRQVARDGWELPELSPSKYRFSKTDAERLHNLRQWRFSVDVQPVKGPLDRPGLGLTAVGCREGWQDSNAELKALSICSPITFILSFERSTEEEHPTAHLAAVNAFEQEFFETRGTGVSIASATTAALDTLLRSADETTGSGGLWCMGTPSRLSTLALAIASTPTVATAFVRPFGYLATDAQLVATYTPCLFKPVSGRSLVNATSLLRLIRAVVAPRKDAAIEQEPIRLVALLSGNEAVRMGRSILSLVKRQARRAGRSPSQPTPFLVPAIAVNSRDADPAALQDLSRYASELNTAVIEKPSEAELLLDAQEILRQHRLESRPTKLGSDSAPVLPQQPEELPVSPVM